MTYGPWFVGVVTVLAYILPWVLAGESGYVRIHDSLDSIMVWHKILAEHKFWFAPNLSEVGPIFENGAPRVSYPNELSVITLLFAWFEPYWAYVANQFILRMVAFSGMYIFLCSFLPDRQKSYILITLGVALCYALLPYWAWTGGVAALPWVSYALIRVWRGSLGTPEIIILLVYPFYSNIILIGMFVTGLVWMLVPIAYIFNRQLRPILVAAIIITISHLLVEYRLVEYALLGGFIPHRIDRVISGYPLAKALSNSWTVFRHGDFAVSLHASIIFYTTIASVLLLITYQIFGKYLQIGVITDIRNQKWISNIGLFIASLIAGYFALSLLDGILFWTPSLRYSKLWDPIVKFQSDISIILHQYDILHPFIMTIRFGAAIILIAYVIMKLNLLNITSYFNDSLLQNHRIELALVGMLFVCIVITIFCGLLFWDPIVELGEFMPILNQVNLTRALYLTTFIWTVIFALALAFLANVIRTGGCVLIVILLLAQLVVVLQKHEYVIWRENAIYSGGGGTFASFYSTSLFDDIASNLPGDRTDYVVASIGLHPSIAQYNGFRTADAYLSLYPKEYKVKFRKAVVDEFSNLPELINYFDDWGNRIYLFSSQMPCPRKGTCTKYKPVPDIHLNYNVDAMLDLGITYLFSLPTIINATELGLILMGTYEHDDSEWRIRVYQLPDKTKLANVKSGPQA